MLLGDMVHLVLRWLDNDREGKCPGASFADGLHCLRIAEAIRQAGIHHKRIELDSIAA